MINKRINLLDKETEHGFMPYIDTYLLDGEKRPLIVVCPGGGYEFTSDREGERIAISYNAAGFHAVVLHYRVAPHKFPDAIMDLAKTIELARNNSEEWNVLLDKIFVCGFSAGGHLCATISTLWNDESIFTKEQIKSQLHKPNGSILCYPVISSDEAPDSVCRLCVARLLESDDANSEMWEKLSPEKQINEHTPPAFLWHTFSDNLVPVDNSLLYAAALRKFNIPFELHVFDKGMHGSALVSDEVIWSKRVFNREYPWIKLSVDWINCIDDPADIVF